MSNASGSGGYGACTMGVVVCVAYAAVAVHNTVAVTALAAGVIGLVVWKAKWFWSGGSVNGHRAIEHDRFVSELAADLAS